MLAAQDANLSSQLRETTKAATEGMDQRLAAGEGGRAVCRALSDVYDDLVAELYKAVGGTSSMSLVATGGWGRRELCPHSDIDFILLSDGADDDSARAFADKLLYPMWDAGIKVGHSVRDLASTARLAGEDLATATSLIDMRHIAGDESRTLALSTLTRSAIAPSGNPNVFVRMLADEKRRRHSRFGASIYLLEPNLKQGIGALRDLHTALWAAKARWSVESIEALVMCGVLSSRQAAVLSSALDFLLQLRCLLQLNAGRATDQLTFEIQETVAPLLYPDVRLPEGDIRPAVTPAVEALMRRYYLHARGVVQVADRLLESAVVDARRKPRISRIDATFLSFNGKLSVSDPQIFRDRPAEMVRLFRIALDHDLPIYSHTKELIADTLAINAYQVTVNRKAAKHFLELLVDPRDSRQPSLLEQMHQVGLLNALMPEFAPCTGRVQHDLYHVYTVDQHQLYAVAMLKQLVRGELADESEIATHVASQPVPQRPLFLATLLHDVGKPFGKGHAENGARMAGIIARRLGMSEADAIKTEFLVRQHLTMSHISQRRDLADPEVIRKFGERVGDEDTLVQLYLLTRCDTAMTAPGNLTPWKDQLLTDLFVRTRLRFLDDVASAVPDPSSLAERARDRVRELLSSGGSSPDMLAQLDRIDDRFVNALSPRQLARLLQVVARYSSDDNTIALAVRDLPLKGHTELMIVGPDSPGFLADVTGVLAAHRVSIDGAEVSTLSGSGSNSPPLALDLFYVRDPFGKSIPAEDPRWAKLEKDLAAITARGGGDRAELVGLIDRKRKPSLLEQRVTPAVPTQLRVMNDESLKFTVIDVFTRDDVGVLHTITRTLAELGLDIHLAKISTEGEKATDAFYVSDADRQKIESAEAIEAIERALYAALADGD